jgi:hypothetical protein
MITNITIIGAGQQRKSVTVKDWLALPLTERVAHIANNTVEFYDGAKKLTSREALAVFKTMT